MPEFKNSGIYLVGDSPRDMSCGKKAGVNAIGVASGDYKKSDLEEAGADLVLSSLEEVERGINFIS